MRKSRKKGRGNLVFVVDAAVRILDFGLRIRCDEILLRVVFGVRRGRRRDVDRVEVGPAEVGEDLGVARASARRPG